MRIVKKYANGKEKIVIARYPNGRFYNHYGYNLDTGASVAGGFDSLSEAEEMLIKHRPQAKEISKEKIIKKKRFRIANRNKKTEGKQ